MTQPSDLPSFDRPPVTEVALGVQFQVPSLSVIQISRLFERVKGEFPRHETHPPLQPEFEFFGPDAAAAASSGFAPNNLFPSVFGASLPPRLWCVSADGNRVIQVQSDRLFFNWRRRRVEDVYPRYSKVRSGFVEAFSALVDVLKSDGSDRVEITQCEVLYFNPVVVENDEDIGPQDIVTTWTHQAGRGWSTPLEDLSFTARYRLKDGQDNSVGRLYVNFGSTFNPEKKRMYQLDLRAKGVPSSSDIAGALDFLDRGHVAIVNCFAATTTSRMHKKWGLP